MIDSGCAMDRISKQELNKGEMALAERVRRIKFSTANDSTFSGLAVTFDIEILSESALVRILDSTPAVLSMGMRCTGMGYSFHWSAEHDPVFMRPDNENVRLKLIGDIPYLTEALSCVVQGKAIEPYRALPAMPAPTTISSRWNAKIGIVDGGESRTDEQIEVERRELTAVAKAGGRWLLDKFRIVVFVYEWRTGYYPDPVTGALREIWVIEYLARSLPVCKSECGEERWHEGRDMERLDDA